MGPPKTLKKADDLINQTESRESADKLERFVIVELEIFVDSKWTGKTLTELQFRQRCGVTVVGIRRGQERITSPGPNESLQPGDRLIVIGTSDKVRQLKCGASV
jgi:K+/H+ antiporter YhaU regulatory subunit KhtT